MENKFFVASNTYFLKDLVHCKNVKFAYTAEDPGHKTPTTKIDYDVEVSQDFYKHIRYYRVEFDDNWPIALYEVGGGKIKEFQKGGRKNELLECILHLEYNKFFLKQDYYRSIGDAGIAVQRWIKKVAGLAATDYIDQYLQFEADDMLKEVYGK